LKKHLCFSDKYSTIQSYTTIKSKGNEMKKIAKPRVVLASFLGVALVASGVAVYADTTDLSQVITAGTLTTFIGNTSGAEVGSPSVSFPSTAVSSSMQTKNATYGTNTERIYIDNPGGADNGWNVTFAATGGASAEWTSGSDTYPFNGATSADGQLTIDPSTGSVTAEVGGATGVTLGSTGTFSGGANTPITNLTGDGSVDIQRVYVTGVTASQTIPAAQPAGTYTINFTQTITAT
jgi:hypothetical protein